MIRTITATVTALLFATVLVAPAVAAPERQVVWWSAGDSYSSGEGIEFASGDCAQSDAAWGPQAAARLANQGWRFDPDPVFTACTGHLVDDLYLRNDGTGKGSLYEWAIEQGLPQGRQVDVLTLTFGGNDLGFGGIVFDCLFFKEPADATSFLDLMTSPWDDCDVTEDELTEQIESFAESGELVGDSDGSQGVGGVVFTQQGGRFIIDDGGAGGTGAVGTGSMADFYTHLAATHLVPGGRLVVAGYPRLFAPSDEWGLWQGRRCHGITRGDANMLGRVAQTLNGELRGQVDMANERLDDVEVIYIDTLNLFGGPQDARTASHELCGNQTTWLNGLTTTLPAVTERRLPSISPRPNGSFHPNRDGHDAIAMAVESRLVDYQPTGSAQDVGTALGGADAFRTPSGNILCERIAGDERLHCEMRSGLQPPPAIECDLDWTGLSMEVGNDPEPMCAGDTLFGGRQLPELPYGSQWRSGPFTCVSESTGLTCDDGRGHELFLSRAEWRATGSTTPDTSGGGQAGGSSLGPGATTFQTPSGNIVCRRADNDLTCLVRSGLNPPPTEVCDQSWVGVMMRDDSAGVLCGRYEAFEFLNSRPPVLGYGSQWSDDVFRCLSERTGLECQNGRGWSIFLSRSSWRAG